MIKKISLAGFFALAAVSLLTTPTFSYAADFDSEKGESFTIASSATPALPDFNFQPSPQIVMDGATTASAFSVVAAHFSALDKENGEAYGMTSEASGLFTQKTPAAADVAVGTAGTLPATYTLPDGTTAAEAAEAGGGDADSGGGDADASAG